MRNRLIVGVFSPVLNWCGGQEWVAVNIINALKENGHQVVVLTDSPLNHNKFDRIFNKKVTIDQQVILPLRFFSPTNYHNIYTDLIRSIVLKSKCDVLIDTFSNAVLPGVNCCYIDYPLLKRMETKLPLMRNKIYFYPYKNYLISRKNEIKKKLVFVNSKFTADAVKTEIGVVPKVLYPSVSNDILNHSKIGKGTQRTNNVTTVARICPQKRLELIPYIAKLTNKDICFTIAGLLDSKETLRLLLKISKDLGVSERVRIITNVKREQLVKILLNSKAYLHPKKDEHFGISIVEAMALGCIPVVHNSGGPKEFVPQNQRFNNIHEAAEILEKVVYNWCSQESEQTSQDAKKFSENRFSKQFIKIFNSHFF